MSGDFADSAGSPQSATWSDIDELLALAAAAAKSGGDARKFYAVFLDAVLQALCGNGGSIWRPDRDAGFALLTEQRWSSVSPALSGEWAEHSFLASVAARRETFCVPPRARVAGVDDRGSSLVLGATVFDDFGRCQAVVMVVLEAGDSPVWKEQTTQLLEAFRELAEDYHRRQTLLGLVARQQRQGFVDEFAQRVHRGADADATAYTIVNDGRRVIGCDRASLVTVSDGQPMARAVSGVDLVERRGAVVRSLEALAAQVAQRGEMLRIDREANARDDASYDVADAYRDQSLAAVLVALPLVQPWQRDDAAPARVFAVLALEWFHACGASEIDDAVIAQVQRHAESAFAQALALERVPWASWWRKVDPWFAAQTAARWKRTAVIAGALAAVALAGWLIPSDLTVAARGRLQPVERRAIFAPADGIVAEVAADHMKPVVADDVLIRLDSPALDLEAARIAGELATAEQQLHSVKAERWSATGGTVRTENDAGDLAAQEESLTSLVASLASQQELVARQQADLEIRSPIAGKVVTWRAADLLRGRPVARGQELLTVADEAGRWRLELDVPENQFRHVLEAQRMSEAPLEVSFRLATEANEVHTGTLGKLSRATQTRDDAALVVPAEATFDRAGTPSLRTGAQATARIHCGRKPIAYVWFHEIWEWLAARVW